MAARRVIVQELVSVDGFVSDPNGGLDFFDAVSDYGDLDRDNLADTGSVGALLLGRRTYELFVRFWPDASDELMAKTINTMPKTVFSSTLPAAPWGRWEPAEVVAGDAVAHVTRLRDAPGADVLVCGSVSLVQDLLAAGQVDELQLRVLPVVLGQGRPLMPDTLGRLDLTLVAAKTYDAGIVALRYTPARWSPTR